MKSIRSHGFNKTKYNFNNIGLNSRLDTIQAGILIEKFKLQKKNLNQGMNSKNICLKIYLMNLYFKRF